MIVCVVDAMLCRLLPHPKKCLENSEREELGLGTSIESEKWI